MEKAKKIVSYPKPLTKKWFQNIIWLIWRCIKKPLPQTNLIVQNFPASQSWDSEEEEDFKLQIKFHCYRLSDAFTMNLCNIFTI